MFICYSLRANETIFPNVMLYSSIVRSLPNVALGLFIGLTLDQYKHLFERISSLKSFIIISTIEFFVFVECFRVLFISPKPWALELYYILCFAILFSLFVIKKGALSLFFDSNISKFIGTYTYSVYMSQYLVQILFVEGNYLTTLILFKTLRSEYPYWEFALIYVLMPILLGVFVYHFVERPFNSKLRNYVFNLFGKFKPRE